MSAITWEDLPTDIQNAVQDHTGQLVKAEPVTQGIMPGLAACLHTIDRDAFVKAVPADGSAAGLYRRERESNQALPAAVPAPRVRWGTETGGWIVMVFDFIPGREADLSPGSPDLPAVLTTVAVRAGKRTRVPGTSRDRGPGLDGSSGRLTTTAMLSRPLATEYRSSSRAVSSMRETPDRSRWPLLARWITWSSRAR